MSEVDEIAQRLDAAHADVLALVRSAARTPAWMRPVGDGESRSTGTLAHHTATGYDRGLFWASSVKQSGLMPEITEASINAENAEHAVEFSEPTPEATEELLDANLALLTEFLMGSTDLDLGLTSRNEVLGRAWSIRDVYEATIRHTRRHTEQIARALAR